MVDSAEISFLPGTVGRLDFLDCLIVSLKRLGERPLRAVPFALKGGRKIKPDELLVPLSCTHYCASTCGLSTWWSTTTLSET